MVVDELKYSIMLGRIAVASASRQMCSRAPGAPSVDDRRLTPYRSFVGHSLESQSRFLILSQISWIWSLRILPRAMWASNVAQVGPLSGLFRRFCGSSKIRRQFFLYLLWRGLADLAALGQRQRPRSLAESLPLPVDST